MTLTDLEGAKVISFHLLLYLPSLLLLQRVYHGFVLSVLITMSPCIINDEIWTYMPLYEKQQKPFTFTSLSSLNLKRLMCQHHAIDLQWFVSYIYAFTPISAALTLTLSRSRTISPYSNLLWYLLSDSNNEFVSSILVTLAERNMDAVIWKILHFTFLQERSQTLCLLFWQRMDAAAECRNADVISSSHWGNQLISNGAGKNEREIW